MKSMKKILALVLALTMVLSLAACGNNAKTPSNNQTPANDQQPADDQTPADEPKTWDDLSSLDYEGQSTAAYDEALNEFYSLYQTASAEIEDIDKRFVLMAEAEAKLLEAGVMLPTGRNGGNYAIGRLAPRTATSIGWGYDADRQHSFIAANELIKKADRTAMTEKYKELKGTGEYLAWAKQYLTDNGYTLTDTYNYVYSSDPQTWDVMATSQQADAEPIVQTFCGLVEYDVEDVLQPALAESWEVSDDGLTYTFHIRQGLKWYDQQGREVADVKADDFVAGFQHMLDAAGGLEYLATDVIVNAAEYIEGAVDFSEVGVKALDDATLQYTLKRNVNYFMSMLSYGVFAPLSRSFYESQGGKFGEEFAPNDESYTYGKGPNSIAYCGPYLITGWTEKNSITFEANPNYWNPDHVNVKYINWKYDDGSDATRTYKECIAGNLTSVGLNSSALKLCREEGNFEDYYYISATDSIAFQVFFNINRTAYANFNDATAGISAKTDDQKALAKVAMRNANFRLAICKSIDRGNWNAQRKGDELALNSMCNSYTPGNFVSLSNDYTADVGGQSVTFPAGTYYGEILQAYLDADGAGLKVWDPAGNDGLGSGDSFDGWYDVEGAKALMDKAIAEIAEYGIEISAENPVVLDYAAYAVNEGMLNQGYAFKQSVEAAFDGKVIVNVVEHPDADSYYNACYYFTNGAEANYDFNPFSGWGPDYGDPSTYLDTFRPNYEGYMAKSIGVF